MAAEDWEQVRTLLNEGHSVDRALGLDNTDDKFDPRRLTVEGLCEKPLNFYFMSSDQCQTLHPKGALALKENYLIVPPFVELANTLKPSLDGDSPTSHKTSHK